MTPRHTPPIEESLEMYLKEIYLLSRDGSSAKTGAIADRLQVAPPSVTEMLERLEEAGLIAHEKHRGTRLTTSGERRARELLRKHCLIERFLRVGLGVQEDVHDEACRLEHGMSDSTAALLGERIAREAECPECYDPERRRCRRMPSPGSTSDDPLGLG